MLQGYIVEDETTFRILLHHFTTESIQVRSTKS